MILYPTETIYGLGVNALDDEALTALFELKGRDEHQTVSWLVRDIEDIAYYAELSPSAELLAKAFLPGPLTLVLPAKITVPLHRRAPDSTIGIRISSDPIAQKIIKDYMAETNAPLTCTSANVSGLPPQSTPKKILEQFGEKASMIENVVDDGPRFGSPSTVIRVVSEEVEVLRIGSVPESEIVEALRKS